MLIPYLSKAMNYITSQLSIYAPDVCNPKNSRLIGKFGVLEDTVVTL